ncbi:glucosyltransferase domain-containing protein [Paenibacillus lacisoli]|nr:glucosyltransferase domain-containing protein [Paenibacillus sp. JX-17]
MNIWTVGLLVFAVLFAYGFAMTHYTLSIDEEVALELGSQYSWSGQGRFGITLLKDIFNFWNTNSVTSTLLAVTLLSISGLVWGYSFHTTRSYRDDQRMDAAGLIAVLLFVTFPVHAENVGFSMMSFELGIGWVAAALAVLFTFRWAVRQAGWGYFYSGLLLAALATSVYQAFLPAFVMGLIIHMILYLMKQDQQKKAMGYKQFLHMVIRNAAAAGGSLIIYKAADYTIQWFVPASGYIENFMAWGKEDPSVIIHRLITYFTSLFTGKVIYGSFLLLPSILASAALLIYYIWRLISGRNEGNAGLLAVCLTAFILMPFVLYILLGTVVPIRGNFVWSLLVASVWIMVYSIIRLPFLHRIILTLAAFAVFHQSNAVAQLFYGDYNRYQEDVSLARQISSKVNNLNLGEVPQEPVVYVGSHIQAEHHGIKKQEVLGYSFFEWDGGSQLRIQDFMHALGYSFNVPTEEQKAEGTALAANLPVWPEEGAVAKMHDLIIVHLSASPDWTGIRLMDNPPKETLQAAADIPFGSDNVTYSKDLNGEKGLTTSWSS